MQEIGLVLCTSQCAPMSDGWCETVPRCTKWIGVDYMSRAVFTFIVVVPNMSVPRSYKMREVYDAMSEMGFAFQM